MPIGSVGSARTVIVALIHIGVSITKSSLHIVSGSVRGAGEKPFKNLGNEER